MPSVDDLDDLGAGSARPSVLAAMLAQLQQADRFPGEVNQAYAAMLRDFYETLGERMGASADEAFARYPLQVRANALPSTAQQARAAFLKWTHGHPVRQMGVGVGAPLPYRAGEPVVVHAVHGTTADFTAFSRSRGNIENDFGAGFYFSNSPQDVAANYAGFGPDLTNKIQLLAEKLSEADDVDDEASSDDTSIERARRQFAAHDGMSMPVYVRFDNPLVIGGPKETFLAYQSHAVEHDLDEVDTDMDPGPGSEQRPTGELAQFIEALRDIAIDDRYGDFDLHKTIESIQSTLLDRGEDGLSVSALLQAVNESEGLIYAHDYDQDRQAGSEIIRKAFEAVGYDGIIDQTVNSKFGLAKPRNKGKPMAGVDAGTVHFIAFEPEQIKSAIGNRGTFDETSPIILHQAQPGSRFRFRLGDLPRDMREELFNEHAMSVNPQATEAGFYAKRVPSGLIDVEGLTTAKYPSDQLQSYRDADPASLPPIVIADGKLLDGGHRIQAARERGTPQLRYIDVSGLIDTDSMGYISKLPKGAVLNQGARPSSLVSLEDEGFQRWFGNSAVVDKQNEPLLLFHGTNRAFDDIEHAASREGAVVWLTPNAKVASDFALYRTVWNGANVRPVYVKADRILEIEGRGLPVRVVEREFRPEGIADSETLQDFARRTGYDGILFKDVTDDVGPNMPPSADVYAFFETAKFKSAIGDRGTFEKDDANILHQSSVEAEQYEQRMDRLIDDPRLEDEGSGVYRYSSDVHGVDDIRLVPRRNELEILEFRMADPGRGAGRDAFEELSAWAAGHGIEKLRADSVRSATGFWKKMGFEVTGRMDGKLSIMRKTLDAPRPRQVDAPSVPDAPSAAFATWRERAATSAPASLLDSYDPRSVLAEEDIDTYTLGGCLDYAGALSAALNARGVPHRFAVVVAPDENNESVAAHVAVKVGDRYYDATGAHDKIDLRIEWASRAPGTYDTEVWDQDTLKDVRKVARNLGSDFDSDDEGGVARARELVERVFHNFRAAGADANITKSAERAAPWAIDRVNALTDGNATITYEVTDGGKTVSITDLEVQQGGRGKGMARAAMIRLVAAADERQATINLMALGQDDSVDDARLVGFYKSLGFSMVGDDDGASLMERRPQGVPRSAERATPTIRYSQLSFRAAGADAPVGHVDATRTPTTPAFQQWFGASAIVDAAGAPLVVYHSTTAGALETFKRGRGDLGIHFGTAEQAEARFTTKIEADPYGPQLRGAQHATLPVYLMIKNPLRMEDVGQWESMRRVMPALDKQLPPGALRDTVMAAGNMAEIRKALMAAGYDGVVYRNRNESLKLNRLRRSAQDSEKEDRDTLTPERSAFDAHRGQLAESGQDSYIVFSPNQIKSALSNRGTFDPNDRSILNQDQTQAPAPTPAPEVNRGQISFGNDLTQQPSVISLLQGADRSTFLHESGHFFLEVYSDLASRPDAPPEIKEDMNRLLDWFGIEGDRPESQTPTVESAISNRGTFNATAPSILSQPAFHGTPHRGIERFDTAKIGSGEGTQSRGWGLYFASKLEVADHYRQTLSLPSMTLDDREFAPANPAVVEIVAKHADLAALSEALRAYIGQEHGNPYADTQDAQSIVDGIALGTFEAGGEGQLYEVDIPGDSHMLLWDRPLNEQPEAVREALEWSGLAATPEQREEIRRRKDQAFADFDAAKITREERNAILVGIQPSTLWSETGSALYIRLTGAGDSQARQKIASDTLAAIGIKGIKYLDGSSRTAQQGSHNYVIFSGDDVAMRNVLCQPAFHGTPHLGIERFDTSKIGTGEGGLAFGWGLYFASQREAADFYRKTLTPPANGLAVEPRSPAEESLLEIARYRAQQLGGDILAGLQYMANNSADDERARLARAMIQRTPKDGGQLYEVKIPGDERMLLWDEPLSEQPAAVRQSLMSVTLASLGVTAQGSGEGRLWTRAGEKMRICNSLMDAMGDGDGALPPNTSGADVYAALRLIFESKGASQFLSDLGIQGIKYRDTSGHPRGESAYNYVVFSGDDVAVRHTFFQRQRAAHTQEAPAPPVTGNGSSALQVWRSMSLDQRRPYHEMFARGFEAYLMEGKAPTPALRGVFGRFREWLGRVYKSLTDLDVRLTPSVRGVMGRMLGGAAPVSTDAPSVNADAKSRADTARNLRDRLDRVTSLKASNAEVAETGSATDSGLAQENQDDDPHVERPRYAAG